MRFQARTAVALAALALVAAACGGEPAATTDAVGSATAPSGDGSTQAQTQTGTPTSAAIPEILEFEAPLLGGGTLRGVDYAGKDVAFWFWAPW
jgi:hypothetical protein